MASNSSVYATEEAFSASGSHLVEGEEVYGLLNSIQPIDNETVRAQIGQRLVLLPAGLKLAVGKRVFVARLDREYCVWSVPEESSLPQSHQLIQQMKAQPNRKGVRKP